MKPKIILKRIFHRNEWKYAIIFRYDKKLIESAKSLTGVKWSQTQGCWLVPDKESNLKEVFALFREMADIDISAIVSDHAGDISAPASTNRMGNEVEPIQSLPLKEVRPKKEPKVPVGEKVPDRSLFDPVLFTVREPDGKLAIKFTGRYDKEWIRELRNYANTMFDPVRYEYLLTCSRLIVDSLSDYFSVRGIKVIVKRIELAPALKGLREEHGNEIRDRILGDVVMKGLEIVRQYLEEKRYSINTTEAYLSLLELFFKYFSPRDPESISGSDVSGFFQDFVIYHNYSASYQNQMISAIKMYYSLNSSVSIDSSSLGRPRRTRALPKVFSKQEVKSILSSTRNIKHRLILWLIYSCGLRRSEVTNIKIKDLDQERGILNIRQAKGMVDRIVPVSAMVWEKIDEYRDSYHPAIWLFEGQTGGRYSSESVYRVFKLAMKSAGIKKDVGVHSLRHSYATHLHENGLDIRYIQELLGHKSTRTTEIYTHVSRRNLAAVRSPIEDLDIK